MIIHPSKADSLLAARDADGQCHSLRRYREPVKAPTIAKELQQAKTYTISSPPTAPLEMPKPALPDLSGYTAAAMEKKIVQNQAGQNQHPPHDAGRRAEGLHRRRQQDGRVGGAPARHSPGDLYRRRLHEPQGPAGQSAQAVPQRNLAGCVPGQVADRGRAQRHPGHRQARPRSCACPRKPVRS